MAAAAPAPMLALLERLAGALLAGRVRGPVALERIAIGSDSLEVELTARELTWLVDGRYRLEARIVSTDPEETRCVVRLAEGSLAGRLAEKALALLPDGWVNPLLTRWLPGVRREGSEVVVSHRALARALLRGER
jgi:hypothetical protein